MKHTFKHTFYGKQEKKQTWVMVIYAELKSNVFENMGTYLY